MKSAQLCSTIRIFLDLFQDLTDIILLVVVNVSVDSEVPMVLVVVLQTTAGWRKAPALAQRVCTQGVASLRSISSKTQGTQQGLEWFGPPERNTLRPLCVVLPSHESEEVRELESVWICPVHSERLPFISQGGAYTVVGSPTGGSNDVV